MLKNVHVVFSMLKKYKWKSVFFKKFFLWFFSLFALMCCSLFTVQYINYRADEEKKMSDFVFDLYVLRNRLDDVFRTVDEIDANLEKNENVIDFVSGYGNIEKVEKVMEAAGKKSVFISSLYLYFPEKDYVISSSHMYLSSARKSFTDSSWIDMYENSRWIGCRQYPIYSITPNCISVCRNITAGNKKNLTVIYNIGIKNISDNIKNSLKNDGVFYMEADDSTIIFGSAASDIGQDSRVRLKSIPLYKNMNSGDNRYKSIGGDYIAIKLKNENLKLVMRSETSFFRVVFANLFFNLSLVLAFVIVSVIVAWLFVIKFYAPFVDVFKMIDSNKIGNASENEINNMMEYVIDITNRNQFVENELIQKTVLLQHTKLIALQGQLSPHFLFNTLQMLNTVIWAEFKKDTLATKIVSLMSVLLRDALDTTEFCRSFEKELEYAGKYMEIQKLRYPGRFEFVCRIDENTKKISVPKCILQPVLENSLSYAIPLIDKPGKITIETYIKENTFIICISDNGNGISPEKLSEIQKRLQDKSLERKKNIGLVNVNQRIKILFGDEYGVKIKSGKFGTKVIMRIPAE